MNLQQAIDLIAFEHGEDAPQLWLDLGAGSGLFTEALAHHLPATSKIIAVDKDAKALQQIAASVDTVAIETRRANFIDDAIDVKAVDGILMANSFHFVKDKTSFLHKLASVLKINGFFLLVEYNRTKANPYPVSIDAAKQLFEDAGYVNFQLLNKMPSAFGGEMFAAIIN